MKPNEDVIIKLLEEFIKDGLIINGKYMEPSVFDQFVSLLCYPNDIECIDYVITVVVRRGIRIIE